ncbi:MAG: NgoFVII family restriction endonuclease [Clostridiales Family XIII bacterium]|nr:NgoFVII family restriction endonuclease [Clostridiales Family XIII bacterium]
MIATNLYQSVLLDPVLQRGADTIKIVSGYTSPGMCRRHIEDIVESEKRIKIELIVGMIPNDGLFEGDHIAFSDLMDNGHLGLPISCSYVCRRPGVHSKIYIWEQDGQPKEAFLGSANYSQGAFINGNSREVLEKCAPDEARKYFDAISADTIYCNNPDVENEIEINKIKKSSFKRPANTEFRGSTIIPMTTGEMSAEFVRLSLLDSKGKVPFTSGLNWGQRDKRDLNQAYIRVPADVMRMKFFPDRKEQFTVLTDDGKAIICVTAQPGTKGQPLDRYKAIHSSTNNSLLGEYFRYRLGLMSGAFVKTSDVTDYGRTDVTFYKIDPETYYMDFSV